MKKCFKCGHVRPLDNFYKHSQMSDGTLGKCKTCTKKDAKDWGIKNPERNRELRRLERKRSALRTYKHRLKTQYGITIEDKIRMIEEQNNICPICNEPDPTCIDHCHKTGKIRGVLHKNCNAALGLLKDNPEIMLRAANYVKEVF